MRTLDSQMTAAFESGDFEPYILLQYAYDDSFEWTDAPYPIVKSKLGALEWEVETFGDQDFPWYAIRLRRGIVVDGEPNFLESSTYYVNEITVDQNLKLSIKASIIPKAGGSFQTDGHQGYQFIINDICSQYGYTAVFENPTAPFWSYYFYPEGRTLKLQSPFAIFTLLKQKFFIYASDDQANRIYFRQWLDDGVVGTVSHPTLETITTFGWRKKYDVQQKILLWRDELNSTHTWPPFEDYPIHNMGYLESDATHPSVYQSWHASTDKRSFHLKYQDGDIIRTSADIYQIQVFEVLDPAQSPTYYLQFISLPKFSNTEGGTLPGTIEAAAPYTPLNTSNFDRFLTDDVNNLQAFADWVNDYAMDETETLTVVKRQVIPGIQGEPGQDAPIIPGPQGPTGPTGATGSTGPAGAAVYIRGEDGDDTTPVIPGPQGNTGATGATGPAGAVIYIRTESDEETPPAIPPAANIKLELINLLYPVGSIYISTLSTNPGTLLGVGTWSAFAPGRVLVGLDGTQTEFDTVEEIGGEKTHVLTSTEMPSHTHTQDPHTHTVPVIVAAGANLRAASATGNASTITSGSTTATNQPTGGDAAHNNLQPYIVTYMWKRTG